jgi:thiazole/oxazole-forming peptide maturase SagD family component
MKDETALAPPGVADGMDVSRSYLSLLGSAGITLHDGGRVHFFPCKLSAEAKRVLLAKASELARTERVYTGGDLLDQLAEIIRTSRRFGMPLATPVVPFGAMPSLRFSELTDTGGRWSSGRSISWDEVTRELRNAGCELREEDSSNSTDTDSELINSAPVTPTIEVVGRDGSVIAGGAGLAHADVLRSALGEAVERLVSQNPESVKIFISSERELRNNGTRVPTFEVGPRDAYLSELNIDWVAASTLQGDAAAIPAERAYFNYEPVSGIRAFATQHTAGLAAGGTVEEAIWAGVSECLERDAYWIVMRCRLCCPTIDNNVLGAQLTPLLNKIAEAGLALVLKDISLDWPIKIVHAILVDKTNRIPAFAHGVGSHTSLAQAARKSLSECLQIRKGLIRLCQIAEADILLPTSSIKSAPLAWSDPNCSSLLSHLFDESAGSWVVPKSNEDTISPETILARLQTDAGPVFWADLGQMANLRVVRVLVQNCVSPDHSLEFVPVRLRRWLQRVKLPFPYELPILT